MTEIKEETLTAMEGKLKDNLFLRGGNPSGEDADALESFQQAKFIPDQEKNPNVWAWYSLMVLFEDEVVKSWKKEKKEKGEKGEKGKGGKGKKKDEKKEEKKEEKNEDDDFDPFAEETEEDKANLAKLKEKNKGEKKKEKKAEVQKSFVLIDVKVFEPEQDLDALAHKIQTTIKRDGLVWKQEYKLQEVAFGVKKIVMGLIVDDETVSVDDIIDELTSWENEIQSVDIVAFNKL
jgi:elongation factor 1-beta